MGEPPLRVLIVNDSATMRAALRRALADSPDFEVAGEAASGMEAVRLVHATRPDVVLMDVVMPDGDGYAATREIMATAPTPIVLVSAVVNPRDVAVAMEALRSGALAIVEGLPPVSESSYTFRRGALLHLLRSMAGVRVGPRPAAGATPAATNAGAAASAARGVAGRNAVAAVGVAASTGGPGALVEVLRLLPREVFPPIFVVQHIARGFAEGFARWLAESTGHPASVAVDQTPAARGAIYVAPDDRHLGVDASLRVVVSDAPPDGLFRPSGTHLMRSLARALGSRALGVVLSGMGDDGAAGALELRRAGGRVAVQDEQSSVVYGMPRAALECGGADAVLPLREIAGWIRVRSGI